MEAYIGKCLDSLLIPEFGAVEVLVVNDGSKDRSSEIAHSYADRYPGSIRVIDKPNGNYGSCINAALPLATGRYIKVLDADDTFDTAAFSSFVRLLPSINDDVVITRHIIINADGEVLHCDEFSSDTKLNVSLSFEEAAQSIASRYIQMHQLAYNRRVFDKITYHQTEGVSYSDSQWSIIPLTQCRTFRCLDLVVYNYLVGREGQTMDSVQIASHIEHFFKVLKDTVKFYTDFCGEQSAKDLFRYLLFDQHQYIYFLNLRHIDAKSMKRLQSHDEFVKAMAPEIYDDISTVSYQDGVNYKVFKDIRDKNYPSGFHIPLSVRIKLSLKVRLLNFMAKMKK